MKAVNPTHRPSNAVAEQVDRRTDVFSLGVLLYELTTCQRLFTADNEYELLRVVSEAVVPRPRLRDKNDPRDLEAIVLKALAHDRDARYSSAHALLCDLELFASRTQLDLSAMSLSRLMEGLFVDELTPMAERRARRDDESSIRSSRPSIRKRPTTG